MSISLIFITHKIFLNPTNMPADFLSSYSQIFFSSENFDTIKGIIYHLDHENGSIRGRSVVDQLEQ